MGGRIVVAVERGYGLEWSKVGIFRTKVDNSGWRIKIVADGGYTHQIVGQGGCPVEPFFPAAASDP